MSSRVPDMRTPALMVCELELSGDENVVPLGAKFPVTWGLKRVVAAGILDIDFAGGVLASTASGRRFLSWLAYNRLWHFAVVLLNAGQRMFLSGWLSMSR